MNQNQHSSDMPATPESLQAPMSSGLSSTVPPSSAPAPTGDSPESDTHTATARQPHALDGSQFHNVIEEQSWSELPPTQEEQMPRRAYHLDQAQDAQANREQSSAHEPAQISVGPA